MFDRLSIPPGLRDMFFATLLFASMGVLVKEVERDLPVIYAVFARSLIGLVLSIALLRRAGLSWRGNRPWLLALRGAVGFSALLCTFESLSRLSLSDAVVLHQTHPIWTVILARVFLGEAVRRRVVVALALAVVGVVLVVRPSFLAPVLAPLGLMSTTTAGGGALDPVGVGLALLAAFLSAAAYVSVRALRRTDEPLVVVFWFALVATPASAPGVFLDLQLPSMREWLLLLGIGLTVQAAQMLMTRALHREPAGRVAAVGYLHVVYGFVFGAVFFGEPLTALAIIGALLVVAGALVATIERRPPSGLDTPPPPQLRTAFTAKGD